MSEFLLLLPPAEALQRLLGALPAHMVSVERVPTHEACGRVLAGPVLAPVPLPPFRRSTVDGYATRAGDTFGASPSLPAYLTLAGEVPMGAAPPIRLDKGQTALVHTGGMIPEGADAVVMVEDTQLAREGEIEVLKAVAAGQNVLAVGEDVRQGEQVLEAGTRLRPQEIGGLMALGLVQVEVARAPRVALISTGDEIVPPEGEPGPGQVRDVNAGALHALVEQAGGVPTVLGIVPDNLEALSATVRQAHASADMVVITAGSSVSARDITAEAIGGLGAPGILVHGVSVKPGKPTILAVCNGVPVVGLPGNPVSALIIAGLFVAPVIRRLLGMRAPSLTPTVRAHLTTNLPSEAGREDYVPVRLESTPQGTAAEPVFGRSNLIFTLVRADGLVRIPPEVTGLAAGAEVEVSLF